MTIDWSQVTAIVPEPARVVAAVTGDGALGFLHAVTTQDVEHLAPGEGALACALDDKGRMLAELRVLHTPDGRVLVDFDEAARAAVLERLARIAPLSGCEIVPVPMMLTAVRGAGGGLERYTPLPQREHEVVARDGTFVVRVAWGVPGYDLLAPARAPLDLPVLEPEAWEAARIASGRPRFGIDVTEGMLVNETPYAARAVSDTKGCYPGQESVARVRNLGRLRTRFVLLDVDEPPAPGTRVAIAGEDAGAVTSAARADGHAVALAFARAGVEPGTTVEVDGVEASVRALL